MSIGHFPIERVDGADHVVRITLQHNQDGQILCDMLHNSFEICLSNEDYQIILDMEQIQYPPSSLIVLLVEMTSRVRRLAGDIKFINLHHSARNNLATFSPISYLSLEGDEAYALEQFRKSAPKKKRPVEADPIPAADIVEDPIIEKIQSSFEEITQTQLDAAPVEEGPSDHRHHLRVKSETKNLYSICDFVVDVAAQAGFDAKQLGKTKIAVYEACLNVIEHAYHSNPDNWIDVFVEYDDTEFTIEVKDYGIGFTGFKDKNYDVMSAMDGRQTGGFGLYIIKRSMDELYYHPDKQNGNSLKMVKRLKTS